MAGRIVSTVTRKSGTQELGSYKAEVVTDRGTIGRGHGVSELEAIANASKDVNRKEGIKK